jgi:hypothetical protein
VECLRVYRKKFDEINQVFMKTPLHDYSSDSADSFRYMAIQANKKYLPAPGVHESINNAIIKNSEYSMNDLFKQNEQSKNRNSFKSRRV